MKSYLSSRGRLNAKCRTLTSTVFLILLLALGFSTLERTEAMSGPLFADEPLSLCSTEQTLPGILESAGGGIHEQHPEGSTASLAIVNKSTRQICGIFISPQTQTDHFVNLLDECACTVSNGETFKTGLVPGLYKIQLKDCANRIVLGRTNIPVSTHHELHFTDSDLRAVECNQTLEYGKLFYGRGKFIDAKEKYEAALRCYLDVPHRFGEGTALTGVAASDLQLGRFGEALDLFQRAELIAQELQILDMESAAINGIALVHARQGMHERALNEMEIALEIRRKMMDPSGVAIVLNNMGSLNRYLEHNDLALELYGEALGLQRGLEDRVAQATTLNNIGIIYQEQERYDEALECLNQALVLARDNRSRAVEGAALTGIGLVYAYQKRSDEALDVFGQALAIAREGNDRAGEGHILTSIADLLNWDLKQYDRALATYENAMDALESVRAIAGSDAARSGYISQYSSLYQNAVALYHTQGQDEAAFYASERGRARSFLDSLSTGHIELSDQESADLLAAEQQAYTDVQSVQTELLKERSKTPSNSRNIAILETQLAAAEKQHETVLAAIEARGDQLAALVSARSTVLSLAEVQSLLQEDVTLVSYYVLGDAGTLAFVITRRNFNAVEIPKATPDRLDRLIDPDLRTWPSRLPNSLQELFDLLLAPVAKYLKTPFVGIIPHQVLHYVPFSALTDGQAFFGQQYVLFELASASSLPFVQHNAALPAGSGALVLGDPASSVSGLSVLRWSAAEARAVAGLLNVTPYTGTDATESRLRESVSGTGVLHLSGHGRYNRGNPLYSAVYLAPDQLREEDGLLEVHEIYSLRLSGSRLVVLSACQTKVGELSKGDEIVGLTRAFVFAGAPSVIASLWSVDDESTQALFVSFYRHWLQEGMGKGQALQAAQADVRADPRWASPYYWSGFVLSGDVGELIPVADVKGKTPSALFLLILIIPFIVLAAVALRHRHIR